ncbi:phosphatase PAP2 family protein [Leucobacter sp. UT-8R-CII-1-4]|uniref:phosphatase PAP2 family protein n=1 Tax=Leucobacter sp. UT-8R-CII-1-4 TaxID=3040075 RepID=UPI0024A924CB|nr:phosphatase PAP2 family protein [Leucobacter sp. UT-8R-CII-1-4]MDI6024252.1 phosphatase PAP2 family protein [Leucobacter sp. UT-8R-CII-1-4]
MSATPYLAKQPHRGTVIAACWALTLVFVLGGVFAANGGAPIGPDAWWHEAIGVQPGTALGGFAFALAKIGSSVGSGICVAIIAALLFWRRQTQEGLILVVTALTAVAASEVIKMVVARPRPVDALLDPPGFSYPSGHSMGAAMLATTLFFLFTRSARFRNAVSPRLAVTIGAVATVWVLLMMWSRTAVHVHWLSDTIAGALLGWSVAVLARVIMLQLIARRARHRAVEAPSGV